VEEVVIIGSGPAGLSAAIYAGRSLLAPLVITGSALGGQAASTGEIENYPGFPNGSSGAELTQLMQQQAEHFGARFQMDEVTEVSLREHPFVVKTYGATYQAKALIVATGVSPRLLGVPGEAELKGRGVSYCATCDGFFYKDRMVVVVGGGDAAVDEAMFLTRFASKVYVVHRRSRLRAQKVLQERAFANDKLEFVWDSVITQVVGTDNVTGVGVRNVKTGEEAVLKVDGMFTYIGNVPNTKLFDGKLELDPQGYVVTDRSMHTSVAGIFAAGDVQEHVLKQVATVRTWRGEHTPRGNRRERASARGRTRWKGERV